MKQEKLLEIYNNKDFDILRQYYVASRYFKVVKEFYKDIQDGKASERNFFENTITTFKEVKKPKGDPDYISSSGSRYWYTNDGVIRGSNHWGNGVANCDWSLARKNGKNIYGLSYKSPKTFNKELFGYSNWSDFIFKARLHYINDKPIISSFKNTVGHDLIKVDGKTYQRQLVEVFEEV